MSRINPSIVETLTGKARTGWTVVTPSRISDHVICPRRYLDAHLLGLAGRDDEGDAARLGNAVHEVLAVAHSLPGTCDAGHLAERIAAGRAEEVLPAPLPDQLDPLEVADLVAAHSPLCPKDGEFLGAEVDLHWWDGSSRLFFRGRVDAIWSLDGKLEIRDYKTGHRSEAEVGSRLDVAVYALLGAVNFTHLRPLAVTIEYLAEGVADTVEIDEAALALLADRARTAGLALAEAESFPANPAPHCHWCQFGASCPESFEG